MKHGWVLSDYYYFIFNSLNVTCTIIQTKNKQKPNPHDCGMAICKGLEKYKQNNFFSIYI